MSCREIRMIQQKTMNKSDMMADHILCSSKVRKCDDSKI